MTVHEPMIPICCDRKEEPEVAEAIRAIRDETALHGLATRLAMLAQAGDALCLIGPLGAGKSSFARAFIQARAHQAGEAVPEVPSPTFTLVQSYPIGCATIFHIDLYRVTDESELTEIGIDAALAGIALIEWPDRLGGAMPQNRLDIAIAPDRDDPNARHIGLFGVGRAARLVTAPATATEAPTAVPQQKMPQRPICQ